MPSSLFPRNPSSISLLILPLAPSHPDCSSSRERAWCTANSSPCSEANFSSCSLHVMSAAVLLKKQRETRLRPFDGFEVL